ncbi:hypothetical protein [Fibrobacter sp. UWB12]|uniref:hypothetical protein n=1 Tax=Fibrobacter sp. UWB12 TaxID=1896203 RepID=UPI000919894C|nr:hypothetical protein [Fibrobacter sp. UWB12]SHK90844.1 hypothetical protein SAMN05720759_108181 [Fibrobacter sp. UWB12]
MKKSNLSFDLIITHISNNEIDYGIIFGRDHQKILIIKTDLEDSVYGYKSEYIQFAYELRDSYGFTVVSASTPSPSNVAPSSSCSDQMAELACIVSSEIGITDATKIYFIGISQGATVGCLGHTSFPQISRFLLINPQLAYYTRKICRSVQNYEGEMMTFVFGKFDPSAPLARHLKSYKHKNIHAAIIPEIDYIFSRNYYQLQDLAESTILRKRSYIKIFVYGKSFAELPNFAKTILDYIIKNKDEILVGDSDDTDILIQKYLESKAYNNITIYCNGDTPKNNFVTSAKIQSCAERTKYSQIKLPNPSIYNRCQTIAT